MVVLLMAALVSAGCTSSADPDEVPDDFQSLDRDQFGVAVPSAWTVRTDQPDDLEVIGTESVEGKVEAIRVQVANYSGDFDAAVLAVMDPFRVSTVDDYEELEQRDIEVAGADLGTLIDATYQDGEGERTRQWDAFAGPTDADQLIYVSLKAPASVFDEQRMQQILDSLEVQIES